MRTSVFKKVNRDILLEFVYDDNNIITESYSVLNNQRDRQLSYIGGNLTSNGLQNQLFPVDIIQNKWAKIDLNNYVFLDLNNFSGSPLRHDIIKLHFPTNWNFNQYLGVFLKVYCYDFTNQKIVNLSNFYYNKYDNSQQSLLGQITPPLLYENRLWDKRIYLDIPSVNVVSLQRSSGLPISGSVNNNLTDSIGLSITTPIFIDFHFILGEQVIGGNTQFIMSNPFTVQVPQSPQLDELQLVVQESVEGDFFEIYPTYNGSFEDWLVFESNSRTLGQKYQVEFLVTIFEENIKGKTYRFVQEGDFSDKIEWRPIIKNSSSTAIRDVEMRLLDKVTETNLTRKALYGLKPEQTSKYSVYLKKIKVKDVEKPKIYVKKQINLAQIDSVTRREIPEIEVEVDVPTLVDLTLINASSPNNLSPKVERTLNNFYPMGVMKILLTPFYNILKFTLALKDNNKLQFLDLTNAQNLRLSFKSDKQEYSYPLVNSDSDLSNGTCVFKVNQSQYNILKKIFLEGKNLFYITTQNKDVRSVIYSGLFIPSDSVESIDSVEPKIEGDIILQEEPNRGDAIVTRRRIKVN